MTANWWDIPTQKTYRQSSSAAAGMPLGPLASYGSSQPVSPMPSPSAIVNPFGAVGGAVASTPSSALAPLNRGTSSVGTLSGATSGSTAQSTLGRTAQEMAGTTEQETTGRTSETMTGRTIGETIGQTTEDQRGTTTGRTAGTGESGTTRAMDPQALALMERGLSQLGEGYSQEYWNARNQQARATSSAKFQVKRQIAEDNLASGRWTRARYDRELANIQDEQLQDLGTSLGNLEMERAQVGEQQRIARADAYLRAVSMFPTSEQGWYSQAGTTDTVSDLLRNVQTRGLTTTDTESQRLAESLGLTTGRTTERMAGETMSEMMGQTAGTTDQVTTGVEIPPTQEVGGWGPATGGLAIPQAQRRGGNVLSSIERAMHGYTLSPEQQRELEIKYGIPMAQPVA